MSDHDKETLDCEMEHHLARDEGEEVYSLDWDNEWGGGKTWIVRFRDRFYAFSLDDVDPQPIAK